jgi:hypothetical protein
MINSFAFVYIRIQSYSLLSSHSTVLGFRRTAYVMDDHPETSRLPGCLDFPFTDRSVRLIILDWNVVLFAGANNKWGL